MSGTTRSGSQAIDRALAVLGRFEGDRALGLTDLATESGLPLSTTHRIVGALCRNGYLVRDADAYRVGPRVQALVHRSDSAVDEVMPQLYAVAAGVGLAVSLGVQGRSTVVRVASARPPVEHSACQLPAEREPLHATAMGKVLLAFSPEGPAAAVRRLGELESFTARTSTSYAELVAQLAEVRRRGFASADAERVDGVREIAVPVLGSGGVVAALGVRARSKRLTDELAVRVLPPLRHAATEVGKRIQVLDRVG
ncbi:MAG TPA: IclR family transcriptional regulator [Flexivirga sp.]|uniref:IclR family transcriptional regulator n=1 Tax=Flexivirga sp. TaxID=1962927 RepID=UPI002B7C6B4C|nr:IclR family transcriptional regulator [Flexivirga sp.]HWC24256.1 IclR family transcriptional regulator [Flexivirga sp.]